MDERVRVALITDVFHEDADGSRLMERLAGARALDARLAVLPELPLNPWSPAMRVPRDEDAEPPDGPRQRAMAEAAAEAGVALLNRPQGSQLLRSQGAEVLLVPRATPSETYERWRLVLRANAVMADTYLLSVNRPRPEFDVDIGGPSLAVAPDGEVLYEGTDPVAVVELEARRAGEAVEEYPGYLARPVDLYTRGWSSLLR